MAYKINISGIVQGVGFRPFVYNLALKYRLKGFVYNVGSSVEILADGEKINLFIEYIKNNPPKNALIKDFKIQKINQILDCDFYIKKSVESEISMLDSAIPLDLALCKQCEREMSDKKNRRFHYAFINCIHCGPRYSIINALPYDRIRTSMNDFKMCSYCQNEYENPQNRRFHAQPNSCPKCGIKMEFLDKNGVILNNKSPITLAKKYLNQNKILCIKGIGGFNLICNLSATKALRARKNRPHKPFAIAFRDISHIKRFFNLNSAQIQALEDKSAPIILLEKSQLKNNILKNNIAPNLRTIGAILAYSPLYKLIFKHRKNPLIFTSANISGMPLIRTKEEAFSKLNGIFDFLLDFNREIANKIDDGLELILGDKTRVLLRAGRGIYPLILKTRFYSKVAILALGAHQKSQIALFYKNNIIISPYIGDLENTQSIEYFKKNIDFLLDFYKIKPNIILIDSNSAYESSKFGTFLVQKYSAKIESIYHHHAHFYSILLEKNLLFHSNLGVIFDGTGLGCDKKIWGGEIFINKNGNLSRIAHIKYFKILHSQSIEKHTLGLLFSIYKERIPNIKNIKFSNKNILLDLYKKNLNCIETSSIGRIFDAMAFLLGLKEQTYEGQSGGFIENLYDENIQDSYNLLIKNGEIWLDSMIDSVILDLNNEIKKEIIASKFINSLANLCLNLAKTHKIPVAFSGGVFQNKILCDKIISLFKRENLVYFFQNEIPPNDGGIAFGQIGAFIAKYNLKAENEAKNFKQK